MIAYYFAGQGSQRAGMGAHLFGLYPDLMRDADAILGYSVEELCRKGGPKLVQTEFAQPAIYVVNALAYLAELERTGIEPDFLLGHSLGEYCALYAAGVFDFATGLRIVSMRGKMMGGLGMTGTMAALLGPREPLLKLLAETPDVHLANDNSQDQIVVAGGIEELATFEATVRRRNLGDVLPLAVSGAFHSPLMRQAGLAWGDYVETQHFAAPRIPVISNVTARPYLPGEVRKLLTSQLVSPVRWLESVLHLLSLGPMLFRDVGPARAVAALVHQIIAQAGSPALAMADPTT